MTFLINETVSASTVNVWIKTIISLQFSGFQIIRT